MPPSKILVINDAIVPAHGSYANVTPREINVREAMFLITLFAPLVAALFSLGATKKWYTPKKAFSFGVLSAAWFFTVSAFGTLVYFQRSETTRLTFMFAIAHGQIEVLIWLLLLNISLTRSLLSSWLWGFVLYFVTLIAPDISTVFIIASIIAGANDFIMAALLVYAKNWTLALGAVGHLLSAVVVFTNFVTFLSVVPYNALLFITLWLHIGPTVGGIFLLRNGEDDSRSNPMHNVKVSKNDLLIIFGISFASSTCLALLLAYVAPA